MRYSHENEFYREAVAFARYQPGTYTLENALAHASAQGWHESNERRYLTGGK